MIMFKYRIYNSKLNPVLWNEDLSIKKDISEHLLNIAEDFYLDTDLKAELKDVILLGSSANYNWTPTSDIDLHLVLDFNEISDDKEEAQKYLDGIKSKWNNDHTITIKGHEVEVYLQDVEHETCATGIYSIMKNEWLSKPKKEDVKLDKKLIKDKFYDFSKKINNILKKPTVKKIDKIIKRIYKVRQSGLDKNGELSTENIVFKLLRERGYIDKLKKLKVDVYDKKMSINEMPTITKKDTTLYAGDSKLRDLKVADVIKNIVILVENRDNSFFPKGFTLVYFLNNEENAEKMRKGEIGYLMVPRATFMSGGSPISDLWKKKFQQKGTENILGHIEAKIDLDNTTNEIYIEMMTVRPGYKRNKINSMMIDALKHVYPKHKVVFSSPTNDGRKFIKNYNKETQETLDEKKSSVLESKQSIINLGIPEIISDLIYEKFGNKSFIISKWYKDYHNVDPERYGKDWWKISHSSLFRRNISLADYVELYKNSTNISDYKKSYEEILGGELETEDFDLDDNRRMLKNQIKKLLFDGLFFKYYSLINDIESGKLTNLSGYKDLSFEDASDKYDERNIFKDTKPLKVYDNGWKWINVGKKCHLLGKLMKNCGSSGLMSNDEDATIISLFDENNKPHVLVTYSPNENRLSGDQGIASSDVKDEYSDYLLDLSDTLNAEIKGYYGKPSKSKFISLKYKFKNKLLNIKRLESNSYFSEYFLISLTDGKQYYSDGEFFVDKDKIDDLIKNKEIDGINSYMDIFREHQRSSLENKGIKFEIV